MQKFLLVAFCLVCSLNGGSSEAGFENPMNFYRATSGGNCLSCTWIKAEGVIEHDTHEKLLNFLSRQGLLESPGLNIHLNSPGGSVIGGILLGLTIRQQQANTVVAASHVGEILDGGIRRVTDDPPVAAECSSACVFAFAGGVSRFASKSTPGAAIGFQDTGKLGVHQFYEAVALADPTAPAFNAEDRIADQKIMALLLGFLSEMNVSAELLQLAARTDPRNIRYLTEGELRRTRIDNRMLRDVFLTGYRNGVAITEIAYKRQDADYRLEIYCDGGEFYMLASIDWRGAYDVDAHDRWNLFDNISLVHGGRVVLVSEEFFRRPDGAVGGKLRFRFSDHPSELVGRKQFAFEDWSSRWANNSATAMSFTLPEDFDGLYLLPRTCI